MNKKLTIMLDMDETMVNLNKEVIRQYNIDFNDNFDYRKNTKYWWQDTKGDIPYFTNVLNRKGVFLNAEPIKGAIETVTKLHEEGFELFVVTYPQYNEHCFLEKIEWIKKYLPFLTEEQMIFTSKKYLLANEDTILIDDNSKFLKEFNKHNGISIGFKQPWTKYDGLIANNWNEVYKLVHQLENTKDDNGIDVNKYRRYYNRE